MSDDEGQVNPRAHKHLLQAISNLGKSQHIRKSTRSEPQRQQDEFQLVKANRSANRHPVGIYDVVQVLKGTKRHLDAGKQFKSVQSTKRVLEKPLEKPAADRLKRSVGYADVKKKLTRWDAAVAQQRSAETQVFPLSYETVYIDTTEYSKPLQLSLKSELTLQMEACDAELKKAQRARLGDFEDREELAKREQALLQKKLTRDELLAKRNELTNLKIRESQMRAKARLKNKIKSKKYHKLLKRQKQQEQIKQFELLQKTDPEAALEKLNDLEKSRVLERASLRHKNTGTWAKNLQIRAKYDKDVRKDLAEQLQISRQLTQKKDDDDEGSGEESASGGGTAKHKGVQEQDDALNDPFNPWTRTATAGASGSDGKDVSGKENWRKYWLERNQNEKLLDEYKKLIAEECDESEVETGKASAEIKVEQSADEANANSAQTTAKLPKAKKVNMKKEKIKVKQKKLKKSSSVSKKSKVENGWVVEEIEKPKKSKFADTNIDDIFDEKEDQIRRRLSQKLERLQSQGKHLSKARAERKGPARTERDELQHLKDLSFKSDKQRPMIDEELNHDELPSNDTVKTLNETLTTGTASDPKTAVKSESATDTLATIDPSKLATVKLKQYAGDFTAFNDGVVDADVDMDDALDDPLLAKQLTISEAFEDDDIVADFNKDKEKESEVKDAEIQLSMPGWGDWAGAGISAEQQQAKRNKRLVLKLAQQEKRRDDNKGGVYINEAASKQLRTHLVSDVPFPFTSVADYEASIRAPIGRNFVPETAFRMLTRPAVITKKGKIIEPMDESELVKPQRRLRHVVDQRIELAAKEQQQKQQQEQKQQQKQTATIKAKVK